MIKKGCWILLVTCLLSCEERYYGNGPTKVHGYVYDDFNRQQLPGVTVYLRTCRILLINGTLRCDEVLDSTVTDEKGHYQLTVPPSVDTRVGVVVGQFPTHPIAYYPTSDLVVSKTKDFSIKKGIINEFHFYVRPLKTLAVQIQLNRTGYQDVVLNCSAGWEVYHFHRLEGVANQLDTTLYLKAVPDWQAFVSLSLEAPNQTSQVLSDTVLVTRNDTTTVKFTY